MVDNLEHKINTEQTEGIFELPEFFANNPTIRNWRERYQARYRDGLTPLIIQEEVYTGRGLSKHLDMSRRQFRRLSDQGLVRTSTKHKSRSSYKMQDTLSVSQLISWALEIPIEEILISREHFKSKEFLEQEPEERIRQLFHAYEGVYWFETFKRKQRRIANNLGVPKIYSERILTKLALEDIFIGDPHDHLKRLRKSGFVVIDNEAVTHTYHHNVDNRALAQFIALIHDVPLEEVLEEGDGGLIEHLTDSFAKNVLLPYLYQQGIDPNKSYYVSEIAALVGRDLPSMRSIVSLGYIPSTKERSGKRLRRVKGIDAAIHTLRRTDQRSLSRKEVADMFGLKPSEVTEDYFFSNRKGNYSTQDLLWPIYDKVAEGAKLFMNGEGHNTSPTNLIMINGAGEFRLTGTAILGYCIDMGISPHEFTSELSDIRYEASRAELDEVHSNGKAQIYTSPNLIFRTSQDIILGINVSQRPVAYRDAIRREENGCGESLPFREGFII